MNLIGKEETSSTAPLRREILYLCIEIQLERVYWTYKDLGNSQANNLENATPSNFINFEYKIFRN